MKTLDFISYDESDMKKVLNTGRPIAVILFGDDLAKYTEGEQVKAKWGELLLVRLVKRIKTVRNLHVYHKLSDWDKNLLEDHSDFDYVEFARI